jgi:uncharacterized membrane protein
MRTFLVNAILAVLVVLYILYLYEPATFHNWTAWAHRY